ncbi:hypothetical protein [Blastococcus saxobsidens]|uniref:hypothetical protein n=1 Tax=Blastococcus saxobsidens TaxID=138336 RepID=UPI0005A02F93|nr:hypothetical protein [Blastococcus saxobsidens]
MRRPRVSDEYQARRADRRRELRQLLAVATAHSARSAALVSVLTFCGLRISEASTPTSGTTDTTTATAHRHRWREHTIF